MTGCGVEDMINFFKKYPFRRKIWKRNFPLSDKDFSSLDDGIYYAFDHWNDYGYRTLYALTAKIEGEIYDFGSLKLSLFLIGIMRKLTYNRFLIKRKNII